jgi:hypothetical protein
VVALPLLPDEEEGAFATAVPSVRHEDRPAERPAGVVEVQRGLVLIEERTGIEPLVTEEGVAAPAKLLRAALRHHIDHRSRPAAELGAVARREHLDLGNRIQTGIDDGVAVGA